jgi:DUF971 family protein
MTKPAFEGSLNLPAPLNHQPSTNSMQPTNIKSLSEQSVLELHWPDGTVCRLPYRFLRGECPCAGCVDEMTGIRTLDVDALPLDVRPVQIGFAGNYALRIVWSDGHSSGLFTWENLARLCRNPQVVAKERATDV